MKEGGESRVRRKESNVRSLVDLSARAFFKDKETSIKEQTKIISKLQEHLQIKLLVQAPIEKRATYIYGLGKEEALNDKLFKAAYTERELLKLRKDKRKEQLFEGELLDKKARLDRKMMFDLKKRGLEDLIGQEEDLDKKEGLEDKLGLLEEESPYPLKDYAEGEYKAAVDLLWQERLDNTQQMQIYNSKSTLNLQIDQIDEVRAALELAWKEDRKSIWENSKEKVLLFIKQTDVNS